MFSFLLRGIHCQTFLCLNKKDKESIHSDEKQTSCDREPDRPNGLPISKSEIFHFLMDPLPFPIEAILQIIYNVSDNLWGCDGGLPLGDIRGLVILHRALPMTVESSPKNNSKRNLKFILSQNFAFAKSSSSPPTGSCLSFHVKCGQVAFLPRVSEKTGDGEAGWEEIDYEDINFRRRGHSARSPSL